MGGYKIKNVGTPLTSEDNYVTNVSYVKNQLSAQNDKITEEYKKYVDKSRFTIRFTKKCI